MCLKAYFQWLKISSIRKCNVKNRHCYFCWCSDCWIMWSLLKVQRITLFLAEHWGCVCISWLVSAPWFNLHLHNLIHQLQLQLTSNIQLHSHSCTRLFITFICCLYLLGNAVLQQLLPPTPNLSLHTKLLVTMSMCVCVKTVSFCFNMLSPCIIT